MTLAGKGDMFIKYSTETTTTTAKQTANDVRDEIQSWIRCYIFFGGVSFRKWPQPNNEIHERRKKKQHNVSQT